MGRQRQERRSIYLIYERFCERVKDRGKRKRLAMLCVQFLYKRGWKPGILEDELPLGSKWAVFGIINVLTSIVRQDSLRRGQV